MFHRLSIIFAIFLFFMTIHGNVAADGGDLDIVQLHSGPVKGKVEGGIRIFSGIPYAAPPVGHLRWTPPQDVMPWTEVRSGIDPVPSCPQPKQNPSGSFSEDCLYLNVWTPAKTPADKLPVMVWIHGGAFNFGSGTLPEYNGKNLAGKGVVVVTINYRLGPLGFLVHPLLSKESPQGVSGNYGLLDQIAALRWVQRNIASFGGDRNRVTIFGQSAGSRSVALLMISPLSKGLFHRAIAQSGGPIIGSEYLSPLFAGNMANVSTMGEMLAARLGCHEAPDIVAAMRTKTAQEVLTAADTKTTLFDDGGFFFAPVFDGWALPRNPMTAYSTGRQHDVPLITGSTLNEGTIYLADESDPAPERYRSFMKSRFTGDAARAERMFPAHTAKDTAFAIDRVITVAANAQPARFIAQSMKHRASKAYLYQFTRLPDTVMARKLGVHHGVDIAYVFGNMTESDGYSNIDRSLSGQMMAYWVNFARTGDPNGNGLPHWPAYKAWEDVNMEFSDALHLGHRLFKNECDFIDTLSRW